MEKQKALNPLSLLVAIVAALAGLLFGFDAGIISGVLLFLKHNFADSATNTGLIVSAVPFGALISAALCGKFNDVLGRKKILFVTAVLFFIGSLICAAAPTVTDLVIGRFILGIAIGIGSFSAPLYIAEVSQYRVRGALVTLNQLAIVLGIMLAYLINYVFSTSGEWRYMLAFGMFPALILGICVLFLPESPRWLMLKGREQEAYDILDHIHDADEAKQEIAKINKVLSAEKLTLKEAFARGFKKVLWLGIFVSILTQAVGINAIIYYAPTVFKLTGFSADASAIFATVGIGFVNVVFTIVAIFLLDNLGRRTLLLTGVAGIILSLIVLTIAFHVGVNSMTLAWITFFSMVLFVACQAIGTGPACWLIPSEIFPMQVRGLGMGISVAFNWGANVVVAFVFPIVLANWGAAISFGMFLIIAIIAWLYFYAYVPETKGVSLEQIEENLASGCKSRELGQQPTIATTTN